jgi:hypothetical protein
VHRGGSRVGDVSRCCAEDSLDQPGGDRIALPLVILLAPCLRGLASVFGEIDDFSFYRLTPRTVIVSVVDKAAQTPSVPALVMHFTYRHGMCWVDATASRPDSERGRTVRSVGE